MVHLCLCFLKCFLKSVDRRPVSKWVCHVYEVAINWITIHNWRSRIGCNESSAWQLDWHPTDLALGVRLAVNKKQDENEYGYECLKLVYISMPNIICINIPHTDIVHIFIALSSFCFFCRNKKQIQTNGYSCLGVSNKVIMSFIYFYLWLQFMGWGRHTFLYKSSICISYYNK